MTQKALIVRTGPEGHEGLRRLNLELQRGWRVARVAPMGGAAGPSETPCHAALVVLEQSEQDEKPRLAVEALERFERGAETIVEEVVEEPSEVVEGNGTDSPDAPRP